MNISLETVTHVLSKKLGKQVLSADYQTKQLHGGTLGDVKLVTGTAVTIDNEKVPYKIVWKTQKRWARYGDPDSWRREYDLYISDFGKIFSDTLRWPTCYHAEINDEENEIQLWMEYIDGVSGNDLTIEMLTQAAEALGCLQGKLYSQPALLQNITCFADAGFMERENNQWLSQAFTYEYLCSDECHIPNHVRQMFRNNPQWDNGKSVEYNYLRCAEYDAPQHLKQMLIDIDDNREAIFESIKQLPIVLCHRDFWIENTFYTHETSVADGKIILIDWDGAGPGYLGEDIASLIIDDTETENLHEYFGKLIAAYFKGLSEYMGLPSIDKKIIWEMMILKFGYRIMQKYMFTTKDEEKGESVERLQKIYEMRCM